MIAGNYQLSDAAPRGFEKEFRTGAYYGEEPLALDLPAEWDLTVLWPQTPPALTARDIMESLERPIGQPPIKESCLGKSRPLVIVDDLNRPTPMDAILPFVLEQFRLGGIEPEAVSILLATGTHGAPRPESVRKKVGAQAASRCRVLVHDANRNCASIGRTSFGTPVLVDKAVLESDFVVGIGGIYPNYTAGFGGGSKLALGVLGFRSIRHLHFRHRAMSWGRYEAANPLRQDLNEIARMMRLRTMISVQINADREIIRVASGDHFLYYDDEVAFARRHFSTPLPGDADVVISNSYPSDLNFTVVRQKGMTPLQHASSGASRIVLAACTEGPGHHGLVPAVNRPRFFRARQIVTRLSMMTFRDFVQAVSRRLKKGAPRDGAAEAKKPIWLYRPGKQSEVLPHNIGEVKIADSWPEVLRAIEAEQGGRKRLKVLLYPCAPLQCLEQPNNNFS